MIQVEGIFSGGGSDISAPIIGKDFNWTGGDGTYQVRDDGDGNWRIKFLSSGTFTPLKNMVIDAFLVGAGGGGYKSIFYGNGGGGGYTKTVKSIVLTANTAYSIVIGAGGSTHSDSGESAIPATAGGDTSAFSETAAGGAAGTSGKGGNGGSGGGSYNKSSEVGYAGGSDGSNGGGTDGGTGQGTTTREFGEADGDLYAGGGGGYYLSSPGAGGAGGGGNATEDGVANTGGGAGSGGEGGSGIVVIRKHKEAAA